VPVAAVIEVKPDVFFHSIVVVEDEWVAAVEMERGLSLDVGARVGKVKALVGRCSFDCVNAEVLWPL